MKSARKPNKLTTPAEKAEIFTDWMETGASQKELSEKYGISQATVSKIINDLLKGR